MERAMLWFKCAAMHDPVRPVIKKQAQIGWEAKKKRKKLPGKTGLACRY